MPKESTLLHNPSSSPSLSTLASTSTSASTSVPNAGSMATSAKKHATIVEYLSTPPLLPIKHTSGTQNTLTKVPSNGNDSIPSSNSSVSLLSLSSTSTVGHIVGNNTTTVSGYTGSIVSVSTTAPPVITVEPLVRSSPIPLTSLSQQQSQKHKHNHNHNNQFAGHSSLKEKKITRWNKIPLSNLVEDNKLIYIDASVSTEEAFNTLIKHQLTSLPVKMTDVPVVGVEKEKGKRNNNTQTTTTTDFSTFDFNDLNSYLLVVLNKIDLIKEEGERVGEEKSAQIEALLENCRSNKPVSVGTLVRALPKDPLYKFSDTECLSTVIQLLATGVHRIAITSPDNMHEIRGILSQRRLVKYLWENARQFPELEPLLSSSISELKIGVFNNTSSSGGSATSLSKLNTELRVISVNGDEPLINALYKLHTERISSIAVIDNQYNLIGNISVTDIKHVTRSSHYHLLQKSCRHFISVILNTRGLENGGKDSYPIFHTYPSSSLSRTIAKLVATGAHRLWIVQPPSSAPPSAPVSPFMHSQQSSSLLSVNSIGLDTVSNLGSREPSNTNTNTNPNANITSSKSNSKTDNPTESLPSAPASDSNSDSDSVSVSSISSSQGSSPAQTPIIVSSHASLSAAAAVLSNSASVPEIPPFELEKDHIPGKLIGVVSLTDILCAFAKYQKPSSDIDTLHARKSKGHRGK